MKKKLMELVLLGASVALVGSPVLAQPPAEQTQTETAPQSGGGSTTGIRIGAGVLMLLVIGILAMRRKGKKKTDDEF